MAWFYAFSVVLHTGRWADIGDYATKCSPSTSCSKNAFDCGKWITVVSVLHGVNRLWLRTSAEKFDITDYKWLLLLQVKLATETLYYMLELSMPLPLFSLVLYVCTMYNLTNWLFISNLHKMVDRRKVPTIILFRLGLLIGDHIYIYIYIYIWAKLYFLFWVASF